MVSILTVPSDDSEPLSSRCIANLVERMRVKIRAQMMTTRGQLADMLRCVSGDALLG